MKCLLLKCIATGGSALVIQECGGIHLQKGDVLALSPEVAGRIQNQYKPCLKADGSKEMKALGGGHYELLKGSAAKPAPAKAEPAKAAPAEDKAMDDPPKDKSMHGKGKARSKGRGRGKNK